MTAEEILYDIKEIVAALEDDSDLEDLWLLYKLNNYRAMLIFEQYKTFPVIDPSWLQPVEAFDFEKVGAADDPAITISSISLGRAILPEIVSLPEDLGLNRLSGSGGIIGFEPTDFDTLVMKALAKEEISRNYGYFARVGNFAYVYPYVMEGKAIVIAEDPTSIKIHDGTSFRDFRLIGDETTPGDKYPIDARLAQMIILQILTNDLNISQQAITDIVNDSQVQLKVLKDAGVQAKANS